MSTKCLCDPCHTRFSSPSIISSSQGKGHCLHKVSVWPLPYKVNNFQSLYCIIFSRQGSLCLQSVCVTLAIQGEQFLVLVFVLSSQGKGHCVQKVSAWPLPYKGFLVLLLYHLLKARVTVSTKCLCDPCHTMFSSPSIISSSQGKGHCVHKVSVWPLPYKVNNF